VFIEGEVLYADQGEIPDGEYTIPLGVAEVKRPGTDLTIIGWSKMVKIALATAEALAAEGIEAEVVDPRTIRPLDEELLVQSVSKTKRCLILEEAGRSTAWARRSPTASAAAASTIWTRRSSASRRRHADAVQPPPRAAVHPRRAPRRRGC
jgi:pyruvate/2-oxoglutarate/acetoin dehydrogenase E1 component